jgi:hypothetical protein
LNGKGAGDRSDVTQSSQVHPIAAGTSEFIAIRDIPKGFPQVYQVQAHHELLLKMNCMLPNCTANYPKIFEDFCKNMLTNISLNQMKTSSSNTTKQDQMR